MTVLRLPKISDGLPLWEHFGRIVQESGRDGDFIFAPMENFERPLDEFLENFETKLNSSVLESGWERRWVLAEGGRVHGEIRLMHTPAMKSSLHRATLMMGIERSHRRQGWGPKMLAEALNWAKAQPSLDWVQLYVFEHNQPARDLYRRFGFEEIGTTPDLFRLHGQRLNDITMVLKLR